MNILEKLGLAVRDKVYGTFMEVSMTTDLKELASSGHKVDEIPLSMDGLNRLYILQRDKVIRVSCSLTWNHDTQEPIVKVHTPLETKELLRHVASGKQHTH